MVAEAEAGWVAVEAAVPEEVTGVVAATAAVNREGVKAALGVGRQEGMRVGAKAGWRVGGLVGPTEEE